MKTKQYVKRCPMCGGKAGIYQDYHGLYIIQCNRCGISTLHYKDLHEALMTWNRRVENRKVHKIK